VSGERRMGWWVPIAAVAALVLLANGAAALVARRGHDARVEPSLTIVRPPGEVSAVVLDGATLYAGGVDGLWAVDTSSLRASRPAVSSVVEFGHVRALAVFDGALWVGGDRGLTRVAGTDVHTYGGAQGVAAVHALATSGSVLWIGTEKGVVRYEGGVLSSRGTKDGLLDDMVNAVSVDASGGVWCGSYVAPRGGVTWFGASGRRATFTLANGLPHADVTCITPMPGGEVWAGLGFDDRGGLAVFDTSGPVPRLVRTLSKADGLPGEKVRSITRLADGTLLIGSEYDGLLVRATTGDRILTVSDGLADNEVKAAVQDADGRVWLGTRNGLVLMRDVAALTRR
jgi:ligand-binding sensor domain-containing protein